MGLGISEAANRITKVTKRAVWTATGEYKHDGAFEPYPQRPSPYARFVHLENSTPTPDRWCLNTRTTMYPVAFAKSQLQRSAICDCDGL
jgi:hypothetical protein